MSDTQKSEPTLNLTDPGRIAEAAERIYENKFREEFERTHSGHFVVIDVKSGEAYHGVYPEEALKVARESSPHGVFHLIRVGSPGAFRVSYVGQHTGTWNWILRPAG